MKPVKLTKKATTKSTPPSAAPSRPSPAPVAMSAPPVTVVAAPVKKVPITISATPAKVAAPVRTVSVIPPAATIEAKIDVGFGNQLFIRGQGAGLSWDRGIPLECVDSKTWRLTVPAQEKLQFKLLLNDSVWAKGEDVLVTPGQRVEVTPAF